MSGTILPNAFAIWEYHPPEMGSSHQWPLTMEQLVSAMEWTARPEAAQRTSFGNARKPKDAA